MLFLFMVIVIMRRCRSEERGHHDDDAPQDGVLQGFPALLPLSRLIDRRAFRNSTFVGTLLTLVCFVISVDALSLVTVTTSNVN